ncbi:Na+-dependent transporter of the SNF family protein [Psychromonas ingrahamii 37]|uniref:Transporter n=1 Tax=Psychromonas ingrahamii (strain DSM 17664 / CCUG 51855 / 37) TaxID=357804 RepID=A1SX23_PSYIN|nr:sodium-dependent transporter [Psychromonas ingrahamii]ABM04038.1 Na+-dependent transporter of the SNF family protein [Psychromonas ingrahamii 37]
MNTDTHVSNRWSSRYAYILAATGAAVGLGNIWKFPYIMGENGGGAFVFVYLLCIFLIGVPVMMAEVVIGKRGRSTPANAMTHVATESGHSSHWSIIGSIGVLAGFLILSFYAVIAGWAAAYVFFAGAGEFSAAAADPATNADVIGALFTDLITSVPQLLIWTTLTIVAVVYVISKGVKEGLETAITYLMPTLFILLFGIMIYSAIVGDFAAAFTFMFHIDFSQLTIEGALVALGHAFFTLSLAMGIMMIYGAYLPKGVSIVKTSMMIAVADTVVALIAGLAIYPIVFAHGLEPSAGPGLLFQSLPLAFGSMPFGDFVGVLFFVMVVFAAFTSAIALLESPTAYLVERQNVSRTKAAIIAGAAVWILSLCTIYSFAGAEWTKLSFGMGGDIFEFLDYLTANILLPLGGILISIFAGWVIKPEILKEEFNLSDKYFAIVLTLLRYVAPIGILLVFLNAIGLFK